MCSERQNWVVLRGKKGKERSQSPSYNWGLHKLPHRLLKARDCDRMAQCLLRKRANDKEKKHCKRIVQNWRSHLTFREHRHFYKLIKWQNCFLVKIHSLNVWLVQKGFKKLWTQNRKLDWRNVSVLSSQAVIGKKNSGLLTSMANKLPQQPLSLLWAPSLRHVN